MATATSGSPGPVHRHLRAPGRTAVGERTRGGKQQGVTQHCHQVLRPRARSKKLWDCSILSLCGPSLRCYQQNLEVTYIALFCPEM